MESVLRAAVIYLFTLAVVRLSGRRTLAQLTPFDLVLIFIVSEAIQQAMLIDDYSITNAAMLVVTLFSIDILLSYAKLHSALLAAVLDGVPTVLVEDGQPAERALRKARVQISDVLEAARKDHGLEKLEQIKLAVLEISGEITVVPAEGQD
jgi:uncharacterized membrane protein YcaP (DUF421 family)